MLTKKNRTVFSAIVLFTTAIVMAIILFTLGNPFKKSIDPNQFHGTLLEKPRSIQPFALTGVDGQPFNQSSLKGQWTYIFFGFTRCGSMCPTTMAELGKMQRLLESQHLPRPRVVMISLDPTHDTLEKLNQYVKAFNPFFYGARGDHASIRALTKELGIAYMHVKRHTTLNSSYDDIEHTGAIMLFNPQGKLVAFFTTPHHANQLADDYRLLIA